jgi:hypothetical protein
VLGVRIQPKGLIATEGIISIPFGQHWPLAVTSHFLEFVASDGQVLRAHELERGNTYEVCLTTSGGLYRYRLNDLIRVDGFAENTPSIRFVAKTGQISDHFGEKLSEAFVYTAIHELQATYSVRWSFAMLAFQENGYTLFLKGPAPKGLRYSHCRARWA